MTHIGKITDQLIARMTERYGPAPKITDEEYEYLKLESYIRDYHGICRADCPICLGYGHVSINQDASIHDPDFGKTKLCPNVDPSKTYGKGLGLDDHEIKNLSWTKIQAPSPSVNKAVAAVQGAIARGYGWVTLWGDYGTAKSLILRIAVAERIRNGRHAAFVEMASMLDDLRESYDKEQPDGEATRRLERWKDIPFLAIDEVDRINNTVWAKEKQFEIFNFRYQAAIRQQTLTLFASNQDPANIGGALGDRMMDARFAVVHIEGKSLRPQILGQDY
jgi:DNA replication protein DnaC